MNSKSFNRGSWSNIIKGVWLCMKHAHIVNDADMISYIKVNTSEAEIVRYGGGSLI